MDHNQIIDFEIFKKISQKIAFKSLKEAFDISNKIFPFIWFYQILQIFSLTYIYCMNKVVT